MVTRRLGILQWRHRLACAVHFIAFWILLGYAIDRSGNNLDVYDRQFWINTDNYEFDRPRRWLYRCYVNETFINSTSCDGDDKRFYVEPAQNRLKINILAVALFYVAWSSLLHGRASFVPEQTRTLRWIDYSVTAPTMLIVLGLAFGADSVTALIFMPILLSALLIVACYVEQQATFAGPSISARAHQTLVRLTKSNPAFVPWQKVDPRRQVVIVAIILLYIPVILPACLTSKQITKEQHPINQTTGVGEAPDYVFYMTLATVTLFSLFAVVFIVNLFKQFDREKYYIFLSMISKTTLHLFLGLAVIGQSNFVSVGSAGTESSDMDTLRKAFVGAGVLIAVLAIPSFFMSRLYDWYHRVSSTAKQQEAMAKLIDQTLL